MNIVIILLVIIAIAAVIFGFSNNKKEKKVGEKRNKKQMILLLWIFFTFVSLLHTMNAEVSQINKFDNEKQEKYSGFKDNQNNLDYLQNDLKNKDNEIKKNIQNKENRIAEIRKDKQEIEKLFSGNISATDTNLQEVINKTGNKYLTTKNTRISNKTNTINDLINKKNKIIEEIDKKITTEDIRLQEIINKTKQEKENIKKEISNRESNIKVSGDEIKNIKGLNPFIDLMLNLNKETNRSIIILIITLIVALGLDLAACQTMLLYYQKLKEDNEGIDNPTFYLILTISIFLVSAYATGIVFMSGRVGLDWIVGLLKTAGMEICKIVFYKEYKKDLIKKNIYNDKNTIKENISGYRNIDENKIEGATAKANSGITLKKNNIDNLPNAKLDTGRIEINESIENKDKQESEEKKIGFKTTPIFKNKKNFITIDGVTNSDIELYIKTGFENSKKIEEKIIFPGYSKISTKSGLEQKICRAINTVFSEKGITEVFNTTLGKRTIIKYTKFELIGDD